VNDPSKSRETRRERARARAAEMTPERLAELRAEAGRLAPKRSGKRSGDSVPVYGTMDAVSMPIYAEHGPEPFMTGPSRDFLFPIGSGQSTNPDGTIPRQLRQGGWIYLRAGDALVARVQYVGAEHRSERIEHVPSPGGYENRGPGLVLAVNPDTWDRCDHPLKSASETGRGYRYYALDVDDAPIWVRTDG